MSGPPVAGRGTIFLSYLTRAFVHIVVLIGPAVVLRFTADRHTRRVMTFYSGILVVLFVCAMLSSACSRRRPARLVVTGSYLLASSLVLLAGSIHTDNTANFGLVVSDTAEAIFQTDIPEAVHYLWMYVAASTFWIAGLWILAAGASAVASFRAPPPSGARLALVVALWVVVGAGGATAVAARSESALILFREARSYASVLEEYEASRRALQEAGAVPKLSSSFEGHLVVVIGESVSRHHMALYGYPRDTTPRLSARRDDLIVFEDVISTASHTVPSLLDALSFNAHHGQKPHSELLDLLTAANRAGFLTTWASNQNPTGIWNNTTSAIARGAQVVRYHSQGAGGRLKRKAFDDALLASLEQAIATRSARKLTILHTMAAHGSYCRKIPEKYRFPDGAPFGLEIDRVVLGNQLSATPADLQRVNCYDSAIRYIDAFLSTTLETIDRTEEPTLLIYLADHGEAPLLGTGHDHRRHSHFHIEIPFLLWGNGAYRSRYGERWRALEKRCRVPASLIDFSYGMADLMEMQGLADVERRSFFSDTYEPFARRALQGRVGYDDGTGSMTDRFERSQANMRRLCRASEEGCRKLWAHRVDSIGALLEARALFAGVETDVVYDAVEGLFRVYHPPARDVGLTLEALFALDDGKLGYWLDWKNSSFENVPGALARLAVLDERFDLKARTIVETGAPHPRTQRIAEQGWRSSYYLPTGRIRKVQEQGDPETARLLARELSDGVARGRYTAVSFDASGRPFVDEFLRSVIEARGLDTYTWDPRTSFDSDDRGRLEAHTRDDLVQVVLLGFASPFDL